MTASSCFRPLARAVSAPWGLAAVGLSCGVLLGGCEKTPEEPEFNYGMKAPLVRKLRDELSKSPCDRAKAVEYAQLLFATGDLKGTTKAASTFFEKCGDNTALRQVSYTASSQLGDHTRALADATALIDSSPKNAGYRVWRGMTLQARGEFAPAVADFQEAFALQPDQKHLFNLLAKAYEKVEKPCDALAAFKRHLSAQPAEAYPPGGQAGLEKLTGQMQCPAEAPAPATEAAATK